MNLEFINTMLGILAWPVGIVVIFLITRKILMDVL
jgi:hypothetical protein